jgi:hypothetical protein
MQMNPSFSTRRKTNEVFLKSQLVGGFRCPQGKVPIRRPKTGLKSFSKSHDGSLHTFATKLPGECVSFYVYTSLEFYDMHVNNPPGCFKSWFYLSYSIQVHCFLECFMIYDMYPMHKLIIFK